MLRTLPNGTLDVSSVDDLDPDDLRAWVWDRLHERDTQAPDDPKQNVGQGYLVGAIYPDLQAGTQAEVRRALDHFLREMETGDEEWDGRPGDALLRLTMQLREPGLLPSVRRMAERGQAADGKPFSDDRVFRLAQVLAYLGDKMTVEFWHGLLDRDPAQFAVPAFSGMTRLSTEQALGVLNRLDLDAATERRLHTTVRGLLADADQTRDELRKTVDDLGGMLTPATVAFLKRTLPELWQIPETMVFEHHLAVLKARGHEKEHGSLAFA